MVNCGSLLASTIIVYVQENVSWKARPCTAAPDPPTCDAAPDSLPAVLPSACHRSLPACAVGRVPGRVPDPGGRDDSVRPLLRAGVPQVPPRAAWRHVAHLARRARHRLRRRLAAAPCGAVVALGLLRRAERGGGASGGGLAAAGAHGERGQLHRASGAAAGGSVGPEPPSRFCIDSALGVWGCERWCGRGGGWALVPTLMLMLMLMLNPEP